MKNFYFFIFSLFLVISLYAQSEHLTSNEKLSEVNDKIITFNSVNKDLVNDSTELYNFIFNEFKKSKAPGMATAVIKENKIIWNECFGERNIEKQLPVNDSTAFLLASVSKTVTLTALMQLWEQGLFSLDDDINNYLPEEITIKNPYYPSAPITFKQLLTHLSSINFDWGYLDGFTTKGKDSPIAINQLCENYFDPEGSYYRQANYNNFAPGTTWEYSNEGIALVAYMVQLLSGQDFITYCNENIFNVLELKNTSWTIQDLDTSNYALQYDAIFDPYPYWGNPFYPAAGLKSSSSDLLAFMNAYTNKGSYDGKSILNPATIDIIETIFYPDKASFQALVWRKFSIPEYNNYEGFYHNGDLDGVKTAIVYSQTQNIAVVCLANFEQIGEQMTNIMNTLLPYATYYDEIYPDTLLLSKHQLSPESDSVFLKVKFYNKENKSFTSQALIFNTETQVEDTVTLFNNGEHGDEQPSDEFWGTLYKPVSGENTYNVGVRTIEENSEKTFFLKKMDCFSSAGPLIIESFTIPQVGDNIFKLKIYLKNIGSVATVHNVLANLVPLDTNVVQISNLNPSFGDFEPGQVKSTWEFVVQTKNQPENIKFHLQIATDYFHVWTDSLTAVISGIAGNDVLLPERYSLSQNYPNPFNPITTIEYQLPKLSQVELSIYNLLGQKVATLVSQNQPAGPYKVKWDASGYSSGIYFCKLETGTGFVQSRKLVVLK